MTFQQDDGASGYGDHTAGYDMTDLFSQTVMGSQPATGEDPDNKGMHFLDNLVAAPNRVGFNFFLYIHVDMYSCIFIYST